MASAELSLRARFIVVAIGAVVPLAILGVVLTGRATRSGEEMLASQLTNQVTRAAADLATRWREERSNLLLLGENEPARLALSMPHPGTVGDSAPEFVTRAFASMTMLEEVVVRDRTGAIRWHLGTRSGPNGLGSLSPGAQPQPVPFVAVRFSLKDHVNAGPLGSIEARVRSSALLPSIALTDSGANSLLGAVLPGGQLIAPPFSDPAVFRSARTTSEGRNWISVRRAIAEPRLDLVVAGTLDPFVAPFQRAARNGAIALVVAAVTLMALAIEATRRITRDLERLVAAAESVTAGDMPGRVEVHRQDEIGRMAAAFNAMTDSLRRTMDALAQREALAAVGEFAAELAHEIRNPLTSMRLDLQRLQEVGGDRDAVNAIAERALRQTARLDRTVSGALQVSRGARVEPRPVVLQQVLEAAGRAVDGEFGHRGALLTNDGATVEPVVLQGDAAALEQLFVNLLLNAAQALPRGGAVHVSVELEDRGARVTVADDGPGMTTEQLASIEQPFFSTKRDGTGLGLAIARRIAGAHGGRLTLESVPGQGTRAMVHLPAVSAPAVA